MISQDLIKKIRRNILKASYMAKACHIGSALSCVEIMIDLFFNILKDGDFFIWSKASGAATYYALLYEKGKITEKEFVHYLKNVPLAGKEVPGVIHSVGSLGHGLPIAAGIAYAQRNKEVYCLMGDAECQEGTTYETALFAKQHKLKNLHVIVDNNGIQACGKTKDIISLSTAWDFLKKTFPDIRILNTIKGKGVSFMEKDYAWHYKNLTEELLNKALQENA